jgi:hypothetical protein
MFIAICTLDETLYPTVSHDFDSFFSSSSSITLLNKSLFSFPGYVGMLYILLLYDIVKVATNAGEYGPPVWFFSPIFRLPIVVMKKICSSLRRILLQKHQPPILLVEKKQSSPFTRYFRIVVPWLVVYKLPIERPSSQSTVEKKSYKGRLLLRSGYLKDSQRISSSFLFGTSSFFGSLFLLLRARNVFLHPRQVVVDRIRRRRRGSWAVHAFSELVLDGGAAGGVEAC